jgi:glycosyltransferase involved in cell wall biosynthesis
MRVLYVINGFDLGGAEQGLMTLLENGFFQGHDLKVLGFCRGHGKLADGIGDAVGRERLTIAENTETLSVRAMIKGARALWDDLRNRRPDLVILSLKQANIVGRLVLLLFPGIRCVSFEHTIRYRAHRFQWSYRYILWLLSVRVDEIWGDCQYTIDATARYFMPWRRRAKHVVSLFCVPEDQPQKVDYAIAGPIKIALAGRLSPVKNIDKVIEAVHRLRAGGMDVRLKVFGDGPEKSNLQAKVDGLGLAGQVVLLGHREAWQDEAKSCDLYVNASGTEGFCIVAAEAMAVGLPVISTDVGGIREYGVDGVNMVKIATADPAVLARQIERLVADDEFRATLGRRAASDIKRGYSVASMRQCGLKVLML